MALNCAVSEDIMTSEMNTGSEAVGDHENCVFYINSVVELCARTYNCTGPTRLSILESEGGRGGKGRKGRSVCIIVLIFSPSV